MKPTELKSAYTAFFEKHEAGQYFSDFLNGLINDLHSKAEDTPETARDFAQRAKGVREVLNHIEVVKGGSNK